MLDSKVVLCENLVNKSFCKIINESLEGKATRIDLCQNNNKNFCCYLCSSRQSCEISCNYLITKPHPELEGKFEKEIQKKEKQLEELGTLFSEGKIGTKSYTKTSNLIEKSIESLKQAMKNPLISPNYFSATNINSDRLSVKRPHNPSPSKNPSRGEKVIVFFIVGLVVIFLGYMGMQSAYQYSGFYYGRYYMGIFGMIAGIFMVLIAMVTFFFRTKTKIPDMDS